jgi:hypothetical protein
MARKLSTSMDSVRSNELDPTAGSDSGTNSNPEINSSADASNAQGAVDVTLPAKRRKRGPNKAKPGTFVVETNACMRHEEIVKLLTAHAIAQLGPDVAAHMSLQANIDGECRPIGDVLPKSATLMFATGTKADG